MPGLDGIGNSIRAFFKGNEAAPPAGSAAPTQSEAHTQNAAQAAHLISDETKTVSTHQANGTSDHLASPEEQRGQLPTEKTLSGMLGSALDAARGTVSKFASTTKEAIIDKGKDLKHEIQGGYFLDNRKAELMGAKEILFQKASNFKEGVSGTLESIRPKAEGLAGRIGLIKGKSENTPSFSSKIQSYLTSAFESARETINNKLGSKTNAKEPADGPEQTPAEQKDTGAKTGSSVENGLRTLKNRVSEKLPSKEDLQHVGARLAEAAAAPVKVIGKLLGEEKAINPDKSLKPMPNDVKGAFKEVHSSKLADAQGKMKRSDFLQDSSYVSTPPIISKSEFVPANMAEHLMRDKKNMAIGVKYAEGDSITNMEGAMHTFLTPITQVNMTGDYKYQGGHTAASLNGQQRSVIMSAAIHPDFENGAKGEVVMRLIEVGDEKVQGRTLPENFTPLSERHDPSSQEFRDALPDYENQLRDHMVYNLTKVHGLPSKSEIGDPLTEKQGLKVLEDLARDPTITDIGAALEGKFMNLNGHVVSLEAFYNVYLHQVRNEFSVLEAALPQGYVYTIDPPSIFAKQIGISNVAILNRLQLLAIKEINSNTPLKHLKVVGFNDFADKGAIALYKSILPNAQVQPKAELFKGSNGEYSRKDNYALVDHNNSDAFGQNIETEAPTSKDGVLGSYSDAAHHLKRDREDLMSHVV